MKPVVMKELAGLVRKVFDGGYNERQRGQLCGTIASIIGR
jgi:hypothetical protein